MSSPDRIAQLEAEVAELRALVAPRARHQPRPRLLRRLALIGLVLALSIPAGVVLATHQFSDVPTSHTFHDDVEALVDAGITSGCGGGKYCLNDPVTRGQMAAFLNRMGSLSGQAPSVNADRVDGRDANELTRVASMSTTAVLQMDTYGVEYQFGNALSITAPAPGFVVVTATATIQSGAECGTQCTVYGQVLHLQSGQRTVRSEATFPAGNSSVGLTWTRAFPVSAGANTFRIMLSLTDITGVVNARYGQATAQFSPFGPTGNGP